MEEFEMDRDLVTFSDDDGNEFELEIVDYFDYEGEAYAVMIDTELPEDEEETAEAYLFRIVENGDFDEFVPVDEDKLETIAAYYDTLPDECDDEDCCACDCECKHE
ncbi:MAG: DUF1292 domain-containing protein [Clostridiales bacterium]|nr:DUF1292 domain-containing protein [Clostridiales bacterium]